MNPFGWHRKFLDLKRIAVVLLLGGLTFAGVVAYSRLAPVTLTPTVFVPKASKAVTPISPVDAARGGPDFTSALRKLQEAEATRERKDNALGMTFCLCPAGTFRMGSPPDEPGRRADEQAVDVTIRREFWMGKFEVTQSQWAKVMGRTLREQRAKAGALERPVGDGTVREHVGEGPDYPVYYVSYHDAVEFCQRLNESEREAGRLAKGWEYRLPTEAEWEYACRAGTTTATAFGARLGSALANFDGNSPYNGAPKGPYLRETTPIGRFQPNRFRIHDMHGNLLEWCLDGYAEKLPGGEDPLVPPSPSTAVMRGGCWHHPGSMCRSAYRAHVPPDTAGSGLGFRVALVPVRTEPETGPK
jgi:formylglycine-generating enzyme required for sulfatase activity